MGLVAPETVAPGDFPGAWWEKRRSGDMDLCAQGGLHREVLVSRQSDNDVTTIRMYVIHGGYAGDVYVVAYNDWDGPEAETWRGQDLIAAKVWFTRTVERVNNPY